MFKYKKIGVGAQTDMFVVHHVSTDNLVRSEIWKMITTAFDRKVKCPCRRMVSWISRVRLGVEQCFILVSQDGAHMDDMGNHLS